MSRVKAGRLAGDVLSVGQGAAWRGMLPCRPPADDGSRSLDQIRIPHCAPLLTPHQAYAAVATFLVAVQADLHASWARLWGRLQARSGCASWASIGPGAGQRHAERTQRSTAARHVCRHGMWHLRRRSRPGSRTRFRLHRRSRQMGMCIS